MALTILLLLIWFFSDEESQISELQYHAPLDKSDHSVLTFNFNCYLDQSKPITKFCYDKGNFQLIKDRLNELNWCSNFIQRYENEEIEEIWNSFKVAIHELRNEFIPQKLSGKTSWKDKWEIPLNEETRKAIAEKKRLHRKWITSKHQPNTNALRMSYKTARNNVKNLISQAKKQFEKCIANKSYRNPKMFWSHVRNKLKTKTTVAPLLEEKTCKSSIKFGDRDKANILQSEFSGVFTKEPICNIPFFEERTQKKISNVKISEEQIRQSIFNLDSGKSCGPDEIHPRMLKELIDHIVEPIALIMNKTLEKGTLPEDWKKAHISPIYKKGARDDAANYRPISLTSIVCKMMESILRKEIMEHISKENLLSNKQYGFVNKRSSTTQLLKFVDTCIESMAKGEVVDTIYFDFAKAFDTVPHRRLLSKLSAYGIHGNIFRWIKCFLEGRTQVVKVNGVESESASVLSGIPQGSVLGPILFLIYINDLPDVVASNSLLYADDTKIMRPIQNSHDSGILQNDINALGRWSDIWLLKFNPEKCQVLTIGRNKTDFCSRQYHLNCHKLNFVTVEKDLGVTIDAKLQFEDHIAMKVKKANMMVGLIRRSFSYLDGTLLTKLYTSFVRPHLEYATAVWSPSLKKNIHSIENVQRRATKLIENLKNLTYTERLKKLDLPTLFYRRLFNDMVEVYKHLHVYDKSTIQPRFQLQTRPSRKHNYQISCGVPKGYAIGLQMHAFYFRVVNTWNNLPKEVVNAPSLMAFKQNLERAWANHPVKFDYIRQSDS